MFYWKSTLVKAKVGGGAETQEKRKIKIGKEKVNLLTLFAEKRFAQFPTGSTKKLPEVKIKFSKVTEINDNIQ